MSSHRTHTRQNNSRWSCAVADGLLGVLRCLRLKLSCDCGCKTECSPLGGETSTICKPHHRVRPYSNRCFRFLQTLARHFRKTLIVYCRTPPNTVIDPSLHGDFSQVADIPFENVPARKRRRVAPSSDQLAIALADFISLLSIKRRGTHAKMSCRKMLGKSTMRAEHADNARLHKNLRRDQRCGDEGDEGQVAAPGYPVQIGMPLAWRFDAEKGHSSARKEMFCQPIRLIETRTSSVVNWLLGAVGFLDIELPFCGAASGNCLFGYQLPAHTNQHPSVKRQTMACASVPR